jgi:hypothetical protein
MSGNRARGKRIAACCVALAACAIVSSHASAVDFLIPGMSLESVSLVPGARVSYLVTSESFGETDSSYVELRVIEHKRNAYLLEIVSSPYPRSAEGSTALRLRLAERATSAASPEAFRSCLEEILIREGAGSFRAPTEKELDDIDLDRLFVRTNEHAARTALEPARITTPAGAFLCDGIELSSRETKRVNLGGVEAERSEEEVSRLWLSRDVPLWGLVRSSVERTSFTKVLGSRAVGAKPRVTVTESILLSYARARGGS